MIIIITFMNWEKVCVRVCECFGCKCENGGAVISVNEYMRMNE